MVLAEVPVLALVAVTLIGKVPAGVPRWFPPPHPIRANIARTPKHTMNRLLRGSTAMPSNPNSESSIAYAGGVFKISGHAIEDELPATEIVMVTCDES